MDKNYIVQLLKISAYNLYLASINGTPNGSALFEELNNPKVGDLVMEVTTFYAYSKSADNIGRLVSITKEPCFNPEDLHKDEKENPPLETIWHLRLVFDDDEGRIIRWKDAKFIKVKDIDNLRQSK